MPVRSSSSRVLRWPNYDEVRAAARRLAERESRERPGLIRLGFFGSYANGTWGVGSDLDLVGVVSESADPFERRALSWDLSDLPVPAEILLYTSSEWDKMMERGGRFAEMLRRETVWLVDRG
ncbi:MAG: nucleotidyltransferase domain-containing protein [bacterium]